MMNVLATWLRMHLPTPYYFNPFEILIWLRLVSENVKSMCPFKLWTFLKGVFKKLKCVFLMVLIPFSTETQRDCLPQCRTEHRVRY